MKKIGLKLILGRSMIVLNVKWSFAIKESNIPHIDKASSLCSARSLLISSNIKSVSVLTFLLAPSSLIRYNLDISSMVVYRKSFFYTRRIVSLRTAAISILTWWQIRPLHYPFFLRINFCWKDEILKQCSSIRELVPWKRHRIISVPEMGNLKYFAYHNNAWWLSKSL